jgi:hypothetical protein
VFENKVLRRTFEPIREETTAGWRKYIRKTYVIYWDYYSPNTIRLTKKRVRNVLDV